MNSHRLVRRFPAVRPLLASTLIALGASFALVALHGGDSVIAAAVLMTACSTAAALVRLLDSGHLVDHLDDTRHVARDR